MKLVDLCKRFPSATKTKPSQQPRSLLTKAAGSKDPYYLTSSLRTKKRPFTRSSTTMVTKWPAFVVPMVGYRYFEKQSDFIRHPRPAALFSDIYIPKVFVLMTPLSVHSHNNLCTAIPCLYIIFPLRSFMAIEFQRLQIRCDKAFLQNPYALPKTRL